MPGGNERRAALRQFLVQRFTVAELKTFFSDHYPKLLTAIPFEGKPMDEVAETALAALVRYGHDDDVLFEHLVAARPQLSTQLADLRSLRARPERRHPHGGDLRTAAASEDWPSSEDADLRPPDHDAKGRSRSNDHTARTTGVGQPVAEVPPSSFVNPGGQVGAMGPGSVSSGNTFVQHAGTVHIHPSPPVDQPDSAADAEAQDRPAPTFLNERHKSLNERLKTLRRQKALAGSSNDIAALDREMVAIKRELRKEPELVPGDRLSDRYELLEQLGRGGFATVWRAY